MFVYFSVGWGAGAFSAGVWSLVNCY